MTTTENESFSADWLALREPIDHRCVAPAPLAAVAGWLASQPESGPLDVVDLGSGTGSHYRLMSEVFEWRVKREINWTLAERDPMLLTKARDLGVLDARTTPLAVDIDTDFDALPVEQSALITGAALLDLVSEAWLTRLVRRAAASRTALYFRLSVSGWIRLTPAIDDDAAVVDVFNTHQTKDKGFGAALGPRAGLRLAELLHESGYDVTIASSNWTLMQRELALATQLLDGYAKVAREQGIAAARVDVWRAARERALANGTLTVEVGHWDVAGVPGSTTCS